MSVEVAASSYLAAKTASAAGGLFGGLFMFAFMKPKTVLDATIRGGVCTGSAIIGAPILCEFMEKSMTVEHLMFCGAVIGFLAWGVLSMIARFFIKAETANTDIVEAVKDIKN
jgi:hypothetical protein